MIVVVLKYVPYIGLWPCQNTFLHKCYIILVWWDYISYTCAFHSYLGKKTSLSTSYTPMPHIVHGVMNLFQHSMIIFACLWAMRYIDSVNLIILVHDLSDTHTHIVCVCARACACLCERLRLRLWVLGRERERWGGSKVSRVKWCRSWRGKCWQKNKEWWIVCVCVLDCVKISTHGKEWQNVEGIGRVFQG